jgi:hypothetical protein
MMPCSLVEVHRRFGETRYLCLQGREVRKKQAGRSTLHIPGILFGQLRVHALTEAAEETFSVVLSTQHKDDAVLS